MNQREARVTPRPEDSAGPRVGAGAGAGTAPPPLTRTSSTGGSADVPPAREAATGSSTGEAKSEGVGSSLAAFDAILKRRAQKDDSAEPPRPGSA